MNVVARLHSPAVFTIVALCFLLPFMTVTLASCGNPTVGHTKFTGIQLVTRTVPLATRDESASPRDLAAITSQVEESGATTAEIAFGAAILGIVLGLFGVAAGPGWCAAVGLTALIQLAVVWPDDYEVSWHIGLGLALLFFCWAGILHVDRWRVRRRIEQSRGYWIGVVAGILGLTILLCASVFLWPLAIAEVLVAVGSAVYLYVRRRKARQQLGVVMSAGYWERVVAGAFATYVSLIAGVAVAFAIHALWAVPLLWAAGIYLVRLVKTAKPMSAFHDDGTPRPVP